MDSEDVSFMLYTSGSTGRPKGIAHTQVPSSRLKRRLKRGESVTPGVMFVFNRCEKVNSHSHVLL